MADTKNGTAKWASIALVLAGYIVIITVWMASLHAECRTNSDSIAVIKGDHAKTMKMLHAIDKKQALIMQKLGVKLENEGDN